MCVRGLRPLCVLEIKRATTEHGSEPDAADGSRGPKTRAGSDTGSNKIKHEERSAATKVNWKHRRETRSRCIISLGCTHVHVHGGSGEKEQRKE